MSGEQLIDWSATPLGATDQWPQSLRTASSLCFDLPVPACLVWGAAHTPLPNARYRALFGDSFWPDPLKIAFEQASSGETVSASITPPSSNAALVMSLVPVRDEGGAVGGVLVSMLDRASQDYDALQYALSHDLLSPLRTLQEMARILIEDKSGADSTAFLKHLHQGATKLDERVNGLLRFVRVTRQPLSPMKVDVAALVTGVLAEWRDKPEAARAEVVVGALPATTGDLTLVRQVFASLIGNAFKFSRPAQHPRIEIGGAPAGDWNEYFVVDNGAGFDMKYASRLFGLFQKLHGEAQFQGAGVDLALARRIIERHGGTIRADASKDRGATFRFTLPAAAGESGEPGNGRARPDH